MAIKIRTYKNNRVFGLILKELKKNKQYKIKEISHTGINFRNPENEKIYELYFVNTVDVSVKKVESIIQDIIKSTFKENYLFDFYPLGLTNLGYTASFIISGELGTHCVVSHKIKEVKKDRSIL